MRVLVQDQTTDDAGAGRRDPIPGVTVSLAAADGTDLGTAVSNEQGVALICIDAKADLVVTLDESTLPEGVALAGPAEVPIPLDSFVTNTRAVSFFTGESSRVTNTLFDRVAQRLADGTRLGLIIAMTSVGLSLIFGTTGLTNFAHGEMVTFGGMMAFWLNVTGIGLLGFLGFLPLVDDDGRFHVLLATPLAVLLGGVFGWLLNWGVFSRLRRRGIGLISQMVVTIGLSIMFRNMFLFQFGGRAKPLREYSLQKGIELGPITITPRDLVTTLLSLAVLVAVALSLQYTRLGKATRAVSDNPDLASATGIDSAKVIRIVWIAGGALAALGGVFRGLDEQVAFDSGSRLLFLMFAGITLGGLGSAFGALVGGFAVGVMVELSTLVVPTELKNTPALLILILVLLLRPQGILGRAQRVG